MFTKHYVGREFNALLKTQSKLHGAQVHHNNKIIIKVQNLKFYVRIYMYDGKLSELLKYYTCTL